MTRSTIIMSATIALLVASNAWFLQAGIDCGISKTYLDASFQTSDEALRQALALLPVVAASPHDKDGIIAAAKRSARHPDSFEKEGYLWVGQLALKFGAEGRLVEVTTSPK